MHFRLQLDYREHMETKHFNKINWLSIDQGYKQCLSTYDFKFCSEMCPQYINKIYKISNQNNAVTRNSSSKLFLPLRTKTLTQKCLSYLGPFIGNDLTDDVKLSNNVITFKYKARNSSLTLSWEKIKIYMYTVGKLPPSSPHLTFESQNYNSNWNIAHLKGP